MNTEENAVSTMLEERASFEVTVNKQGMLHKFGILPKKVAFEIRPLCLGSLVRVSRLLLSIGEVDLQKPIMEIAPEQIVKHARTLAEIAAIAATNSPEPPSKRLIDFFYNNLTAEELCTVIETVKRKMDVSNFLLSIVSARGMNLFREVLAGAKNDTPEISGAPSAG